MSDSATITREQLRTVYIATELGGNAGDSKRFSYAKLGSSSYSFGQLQYDVDHNPDARAFLQENGFAADDIKDLRSHGGLSDKRVEALDAKMQMIPQAKMDQFTNVQLDKTIASVGDVIDDVRKQKPAAADAIAQDSKLQLGIADYINQFGPPGSQFVGFLAENQQILAGGKVQAGHPPTREDVQTFIESGKFGQNPHNARGIAGREAHFNEAMGELGLGPVARTHSQTEGIAGSTLKQGAHGETVTDLQTKLSGLGYLDAKSIDGDFGIHTRHAVERFQTDQGLTADGKVGSLTMGPLNAAVRDKQIPDFTSNSGPILRDFTDPNHPQNALYNTLQEGFPPGTSPERLTQATAACYMQGIKQPNDLGNVCSSTSGDKILFASNSVFANGPAVIDVNQPTPSVQQTMQQLQSFDGKQAQFDHQIQTQIQTQNAQAPQGPVLGGAPTPGGMGH